MQLTCPCCSARFPVEAALADDAARATVAAALALPAPLADLTLRYLALFRPVKRALSWDRAARLLTELVACVRAAQVVRNGIAQAAPLELWRAALEQAVEARDRLTLPLKSHGYLFEVVAGLATKNQSARERVDEDRKRHRPHASSGARPLADVIQRAASYQAGAANLKKALK